MHTLILNDQIALVAGRDGYFLVNRKDYYIGKSLEAYGEHGSLEGAFLRRLIKPGDNVVEVGSNIGAHTIGLAKAVGPQGRVYAFEPQRNCYALLQAQIALNQLTNIFAYNEALGQKQEKLWLPSINYSEVGNFGAVQLLTEWVPGSDAIEVTTLDQRFGDVACAMIKIDVEGFEEEVIRGGINLIEKQHPLLYVENDRVEKSKSLVALLLELRYRLWWHIPRLYNSNNFFKINQNIYGDTSSFNMFCSHEYHDAADGLIEIRSPSDPHPLARQNPILRR